MDTPVLNKPKTMAELLPGLSGILTKEARQAVTVLKQPRPTIAATRTTEKPYKPMTIAEMRADIKVLSVPSPRKIAQQRKTEHQSTSVKKKWNSSVKVKKTISLKENQAVNNPVRKVLNFQQLKSKIQTNTALSARMTLNPNTPCFEKPKSKPKRSLHPQAEVNSILSISGICNIEATPLVTNKPIKTRMTLANKENVSGIPKVKITATTPKSSLRKRILASRIPDTPLSNESWKSSCDESFLQNEKKIELSENNAKEPQPETFNPMSNVTPPASTPYKEYRNVTEFFDNSTNDSSAAQDNTIMCFDTNSISKENNKREESVIVSLCDMFNKATVSVTNTENVNVDLLEVEKQTVNNIAMIDNALKILNNIKEAELKSLQRIEKLIVKRKQTLEIDKEKTIIEMSKEVPMSQDVTPIKVEVAARPCSVIKSCLKSPSYKIPKKMTASVKKKVHYRSLPNVTRFKASPEKEMGGKALSMYLEMKEHMNFLSTPGKQCTRNFMDTPTAASHNLQKQLDKLYNES